MNHGNHWELLFSQNVNIINGLLFIILFLSIYVIYRSYFSKGGDSSESTAHSAVAFDPSAIETTLTRILEKQSELQTKVQSVPRASSGNSTVSPEIEEKLQQAEAKMEELKNEVEEKQKQIQELQSGAGAGQPTGEVSDELKKKLEELETKLAEYEIISDDLADLSKYKNENVALKKEIDELKKQKPAVSEASAPAPAPTAKQEASSAPAPAPEVSAPAPEVQKTEVSTQPDLAQPELADPQVAAEVSKGVAETSTPEINSDPFAAPFSQDEQLVVEPSASVGDKVGTVKSTESGAEQTQASTNQPEKFEEPTAAGASVTVSADSGEIKDMIDDDLMKEFEMAVAQQKKGVIDTPQATEEKAEIKASEAGELIDQFENFVKKD